MRLVVHGHQVYEGNLRILLRGGEPRVAQQLLDGAQVGAVGQQVRGVRVAEAVRMDGRIAAQVDCVKLDDAVNAARGQAMVAVVDWPNGYVCASTVVG